MTNSLHKHLPYLDGWRGLAIVLLLAGHFFPVGGLYLGAVGVKLFFVLSGYLMGRILFFNQTPIPLFLRRRASRILPPVAVFIVLVVGWRLINHSPVAWVEVAAAAAFVNNYVAGVSHNPLMPFGHFWSLCVEEHSYFLLSFVAVAARANLVRAKLAVLVFSLLSGIAGIAYFFAAQLQLDVGDPWPRTEVAALPLFLSVLLLLQMNNGRKLAVPAWAVPLLVLLGVGIHWWSIPAPVQTIVGGAAFALAINLLGDAPRATHLVLSFHPLRQMGVWSFSIYLWQQPFFHMVQKGELSQTAGLATSLAIGIAAYYAVEQPARAYLNRVWDATPSTQVSVESNPVTPVARPGNQNA